MNAIVCFEIELFYGVGVFADQLVLTLTITSSFYCYFILSSPRQSRRPKSPRSEVMLLVQNECTTAGVPRSLKVMQRWLRLMAHSPRAANQAERRAEPGARIYPVT